MGYLWTQKIGNIELNRIEGDPVVFVCDLQHVTVQVEESDEILPVWEPSSFLLKAVVGCCETLIGFFDDVLSQCFRKLSRGHKLDCKPFFLSPKKMLCVFSAYNRYIRYPLQTSVHHREATAIAWGLEVVDAPQEGKEVVVKEKRTAGLETPRRWWSREVGNSINGEFVGRSMMYMGYPLVN